MACRGFWECLLKLLNFLLTVTGLAMVGYGIYLLVEFSKASDSSLNVSTVSDGQTLVQLGRPLLMAVPLSDSFFDDLPKAWYECFSTLDCFGGVLIEKCVLLACWVYKKQLYLLFSLEFVAAAVSWALSTEVICAEISAYAYGTGVWIQFSLELCFYDKSPHN